MGIEFRFVRFDPRQFGGSEIARRVKIVLPAIGFTQRAISLFAIGNRTAVTPDDSRTEHVLILVHTDQTVHLIADADSGYIIGNLTFEI